MVLNDTLNVCKNYQYEYTRSSILKSFVESSGKNNICLSVSCIMRLVHRFLGFPDRKEIIYYFYEVLDSEQSDSKTYPLNSQY